MGLRAKKRLLLRLILIATGLWGSVSLALSSTQTQDDGIKDDERRAKIEKIIQERQVENEAYESHPFTYEELKQRNLVEVEPVNILPGDLSTVYKILPYKVRRPKRGQQLSLTYSQYNPLNYQSDTTIAFQGNFAGLYGAAETPLIEATYDYRFNVILGSLAAEIGYGYYSNTANPNTVVGTARLNVQPIRLAVRYTADNLFYEPYVAPYISGGVYSMLYSENYGNVTFSGNTQPAPFYSAGVLFQLNWLDPISAVTSYTESGLENTYVFAEIRQFMKSSASKDPDFSNGPTLGFGISFEF